MRYGAQRAQLGHPASQPVEAVAVGHVEGERLGGSGPGGRQLLGCSGHRALVAVDHQQHVDHADELARALEAHATTGTGGNADGRHPVPPCNGFEEASAGPAPADPGTFPVAK